jgi:hypothetical protein
MPTNRTPIERTRHPYPKFTVEVLELFVELEMMGSRQNTLAFAEGSKRLAALLGLTSEWLCSGCHVHDRSEGPCHPEGYAANSDWHRVRAVRELLLEAVGKHPPETATQVEVASTASRLFGGD